VAGVSGETWINMTGNAAMAKGGSGDILSGIIAAALARRPVDPSSPGQRQMVGEPESTPARTRVHEIYESNTRDKVKEYQAQQLQLTSERAAAFLKDIAVAAAVYLHGLAGDFARDMLHENTVIATDLLEQLSECFRDCELQMDRRLLYLQK
jgi:NAD(P)H-hydrate epimerase